MITAGSTLFNYINSVSELSILALWLFVQKNIDILNISKDI